MSEYHKIYGPFKRHTEGPKRNKLIIDEWMKSEFSILQDNLWFWTEKIDGTNIRVIWDGNRVTFGGKTDRAQIPAKLVSHLQETFTEELIEQKFGDTPVVLYGEGCGAGIQKGGGNYSQEQRFILFDVRVEDRSWLPKDAVSEVADELGLAVADVVFSGTIWEAIDYVRYSPESFEGKMNFPMEGLVGVPEGDLLNRYGGRIITKVKTVDFKDLDAEDITLIKENLDA